MSELEKDLVFAGVDTHKDTHTLCLLDHMGRAIGTFRFAADACVSSRLRFSKEQNIFHKT